MLSSQTRKKEQESAEQVESLTFWDHLEEFRWVMIRSLVVLTLLLPFTYWKSQEAINRLIHDCAPPGFSLQYFTLMEPFFTQLKVALVMTLFLAFPYVAWQLWKFSIPAMYSHERQHIGRLALASWALFVGGSIFGYYTVLPAIVRFSLSFQTASVHQSLGLGDFITMMMVLMLSFGLMFQLPIVIITLVRTGLVRKQTLKQKRPLVAVCIGVLAIILTPPDVMSQLIMAAPAYLLFEISLFISREPVPKNQET